MRIVVSPFFRNASHHRRCGLSFGELLSGDACVWHPFKRMLGWRVSADARGRSALCVHSKLALHLLATSHVIATMAKYSRLTATAEKLCLFEYGRKLNFCLNFWFAPVAAIDFLSVATNRNISDSRHARNDDSCIALNYTYGRHQMAPILRTLSSCHRWPWMNYTTIVTFLMRTSFVSFRSISPHL